MAVLEWTDALSVGFEEIDDDHKRLISIINKLSDATTANLGTGVAGEILDELVSYTDWHFRHEERLMQTFGYPEFFNHKQQHEELIEAVLGQQKKYLEGDPDVAKDILSFLGDWLTNHILGTDMETGHFLAEHAD